MRESPQKSRVRRMHHVLRLFRTYVDDQTPIIFDAGCGADGYPGELGSGGIRMFGLDASEEMLAASGALLRERG